MVGCRSNVWALQPCLSRFFLSFIPEGMLYTHGCEIDTTVSRGISCLDNVQWRKATITSFFLFLKWIYLSQEQPLHARSSHISLAKIASYTHSKTSHWQKKWEQCNWHRIIRIIPLGWGLTQVPLRYMAVWRRVDTRMELEFC